MSAVSKTGLLSGLPRRSFYASSVHEALTISKFRRLSYSWKPLPSPSSSSSLTALSLRNPNGLYRSRLPFSPVMQWQDFTVKREVGAPASIAYKLYSDRESIPQWMPFISSVELFKDKPELSRWTVSIKAFGQNMEYSWLAQHLQPIANQKIHWRSLEGLPCRGSVRFFPTGPSSCLVEVSCSYEVPQLLVPLAPAVKLLSENLTKTGLERFAALVKSS